MLLHLCCREAEVILKNTPKKKKKSSNPSHYHRRAHYKCLARPQSKCLEANQNLPEELSKKDFPNSLMLISINSPPAKCNEPEHIVAINAQK